MKDKRKVLHYMLLALVLVIGFSFFMLFRYQPRMQFAAVCATVVGYVSWGILHHHSHKELSKGVMTEYILMGLLVILLFALSLSIRGG